MDNNKAPPKIVKNPLLQSANYGFPLDSFRTNALVVPVSQEQTSSASITGMLVTYMDQVIGQYGDKLLYTFYTAIKF